MPESIVASPYQAILCSFDSISMFCRGSQQYLDPTLLQTITIGSSGFEDFYLGIVIDLTSIRGRFTFDGEVNCKVVNTTTGDTLEDTFSFIVESRCYVQASEYINDGLLVDISRGRNYMVSPELRGRDGIVTPIVNGHESGKPIVFVLEGQAGALVRTGMIVRRYLRHRYQSDSLRCSFDKLVYWVEAETKLSVDSPDTIRLDSCGIATITVGIFVEVPFNVTIGEYWTAVGLEASYIGFKQENTMRINKRIAFHNTQAFAEYNVVVADLPVEYSLYQNFPNPFNPLTKIRYELPVQDHVVLKIYSLLGEEVATLVKTTQPAGVYEVIWNAKNFASGIYEYRIQTPSFVSTRKLILTK